jgi:plasmid stabilization system protein ParE
VNYKVRYTVEAKEDLKRLFSFLTKQDLQAAQNARQIIAASTKLLEQFPFTCRKAVVDNACLRELVIPFGGAGYVALFEIENEQTVTIISVRHQREDDYH